MVVENPLELSYVPMKGPPHCDSQVGRLSGMLKHLGFPTIAPPSIDHALHERYTQNTHHDHETITEGKHKSITSDEAVERAREYVSRFGQRPDDSLGDKEKHGDPEKGVKAWREIVGARAEGCKHEQSFLLQGGYHHIALTSERVRLRCCI